MNIGLGTGARGADVERLQRILTSQACAVGPSELDRGEFRSAAIGAVRAIQVPDKSGPARAVGAPTPQILLHPEPNVPGNGRQGGGSGQLAVFEADRGVVQGK